MTKSSKWFSSGGSINQAQSAVDLSDRLEERYRKIQELRERVRELDALLLNEGIRDRRSTDRALIEP